MSWKSLIQLFCAEFFGTTFLLWLGCMSTIIKPGPQSFLIIGIGFGVAVGISVHIFGPLSDCHINPALSIAALILGKINYIQVVVYILAQLLGAHVGYGLMYVLIPESFRKVDQGGNNYTYACVTVVAEGISDFRGAGIEFGATFILTFLCGAAWDVRNADVGTGSIIFGLAVCGLIVSTGNLTGCGMNPARTLAPAIFNWQWKNHWIYVLGPICGSIAAAVIYRYMFDTYTL